MKPKLHAQSESSSKLENARHRKATGRVVSRSESGMGSGESDAYMPASEAKNHFATVLERVSKGQQVFITKHNAAKAVVISVERYRSLSGAATSLLDTLTAEFDVRFERMQTPGVRMGMKRAFDATPDELAKSAVKAARKRP